MLRECSEHGYYRAEECPICGSEGKFLMDEGELDHLGRTLAGVLRHFPDKFKLKVDEHGWVNVKDFVRAMQSKEKHMYWLRPYHINAIIETDPKGRYQIKNEMMRATYGHSFEVDLDLPTIDIPPQLYYPTTEEEVEILLETGLKPADRKWVHLSLTWEAAHEAGSHRTESPIILEIDSEGAVDDGGIKIMKAGTTVFITTEVPPEYLHKAEKPEMAEE